MQQIWSRLTTQFSWQVVFVALLLLGVGVSQFARNSSGFNQDEVANAYKSYVLAEMGQDKWGYNLPAYFLVWGSGQTVLLIYLTVPVIKAVGLSIFSARLVPLVLGMLTLPLFFLSLRSARRFSVLLSTLLLALVLWHFILSCWALESNLVPFSMPLVCFCLSRAFLIGRQRWIVPCLLPFARSLYAYGTMGVALLGFGRIRLRGQSWLLTLVSSVLVASPFMLFFVENYVVARRFAWTDTLFFSTLLLLAMRISQIAGAYWTDIVGQNMRFLVTGFDDGPRYNLMLGYKLLLSLTRSCALVGGVVGGWKLVRRRSWAFGSLASVMLVIFGAWGLAALGLFYPVELNVNRFNQFYFLCVALNV